MIFFLIEKYFSEEGEGFLVKQMLVLIFLDSWSLKNISIKKSSVEWWLPGDGGREKRGFAV